MKAPTNLNHARKRKLRAAKERAAAANRAREGLSNADRALGAKEELNRARRLAGARREEPSESSGQQEKSERAGEELRCDPGTKRE
jgi:hypothetical protein